MEFCSIVAATHRLNPTSIKLMENLDGYIIIEYPRPWNKAIEETPGFPQQVLEFIRESRLNLKILAVAPNPAYRKNKQLYKLMIYLKPKEFASEYKGYEFETTLERMGQVIKKFFEGSMIDYLGEISNRDVLVCNHGNRDVCCGKFGYGIYKQLLETPRKDVRVWISSHISGHRMAPTMVTFPDARFWVYLTSEVAEQIIDQTGDPNSLLPYYRGMIGYPHVGQLLEREGFSRYGYNWFKMQRASKLEGNEDRSVLVYKRVDGQEARLEGHIEQVSTLFLPESHCTDAIEIPVYELKTN